MTWPRCYRLIGRLPVPSHDLMEWARDRAEGAEDKWRVGGTHVGEMFVSTVFLGLDHNWTGQGPPRLFETMILGAEDDGGGRYMKRCATWIEAEALHGEAVAVAEAWQAEAERQGKKIGARTRLEPDTGPEGEGQAEG